MTHEQQLNAIAIKAVPISHKAEHLRSRIGQAEAIVAATDKRLPQLASQVLELERERDRLLTRKAEAQLAIVQLEPELAVHTQTLRQYRDERQVIRQAMKSERDRDRQERVTAMHAEMVAGRSERAAFTAQWLSEEGHRRAVDQVAPDVD